MKLWRELKEKGIQCMVCPHFCAMKEGESGKCGVRINKKHKVNLLVYGKPLGLHLDPIEKKPLFHFLPGTDTLSFGTYGCNLACPFCQNWHMSSIHHHTKVDDLIEQLPKIEPEEIVEKAIELGARSISYTYNEPTIFLEFVLDVMKIAKKNDLKNIFVSNGFMTEITRKQLRKLDAINIDLKSMDNELYKKLGGRLDPVLESIKYFYNEGKWIEITTLIVTGFNDSIENIEKTAEFISSISRSIPWHVTRYYPAYKYSHQPTDPQLLEKAFSIGKKKGLKYVYIGNIETDKETTYCPSCGEPLIVRNGFIVEVNLLEDGKCIYCGEVIEGVWN